MIIFNFIINGTANSGFLFKTCGIINSSIKNLLSSMQILKLSHLFSYSFSLRINCVRLFNGDYPTVVNDASLVLVFFLHLPSVDKLIDRLIGFSNHAVQADTHIYINERFRQSSNVEEIV